MWTVGFLVAAAVMLWGMEDVPGYVTRDLRRRQMLEAISGYSEDHWAAGWLTGIEQEVRALGGLWILMAAACGGWPLGYEAEHGWEPLTETERQALQLMTSETPED